MAAEAQQLHTSLATAVNRRNLRRLERLVLISAADKLIGSDKNTVYAHGKSPLQKQELLSSPDLPTSEGQGCSFCLPACLTSECRHPTGPALPVSYTH
jgi:hypothetical protein